jgi:hypothetical protein
MLSGCSVLRVVFALAIGTRFLFVSMDVWPVRLFFAHDSERVRGPGERGVEWTFSVLRDKRGITRRISTD